MFHSTLSHQNVNQINRILQTEKYNGRVNIVEPTDPMARIKMQEQIAIKNKSSNYYDAMIGDWEWNTLSKTFFSAENMQIVQNGLRAGVAQMSDNKIIIPPQNVDTLAIIMRQTFSAFAEHVPTDITGQIERLNKRVLDRAIPIVYSEAVGYMKYMMDISTLRVPLDMPKMPDRDYKSLELGSRMFP
jgi:hypothetical protein